tara:strand:- start:7629 stop:9326 length:1698 start_codon:yes stop_codon:yes gene_type:complete
MPVGYGYIRDDKPAIVDWAAITKNARESIQKIEEDRQKKREGVDQAIRDQSEVLLNKPRSQNVDYNTAMSDMSAQLEDKSLQNYNDLRLGNINLNHFNAVSNTLLSETKGVIAIAKVYAEQYDANVECAQNDTCSGYANWTNDMTQEMMDFQGVSTIVDPTGKISFVKTREDGTTETLDTSELFTLATMKQQKYDLKKGIDDAKSNGAFSYENNLGEKVTGYFINPTTGKINTDELDNASASMVAQDSNAYGILHDYIGGYDFERLPDNFFTGNPTGEEQKAALKKLQEENEKIIYVGSNGLPIVSKKQRDEAQAYARERLEAVALTSQKEVKPKTATELLREELEIEALQNQVELGDIKISDALKKLGVNLSTFNAQLEADIKNYLGDDFNSTYDESRRAFLGGDKRKAKNAIEASLAKLNEYGAWAGVEVRLDGNKIIFSTPVFNSKGQPLDDPFELKFNAKDIKSGEQLQKTLEAFISNYSEPLFIQKAYRRGKFTEPVPEKETIPDDRTEIVLSFGTISVPEGGDKKSYVDFNAFKREYPNAVFNDFIIYTRPDLAGVPAQ